MLRDVAFFSGASSSCWRGSTGPEMFSLLFLAGACSLAFPAVKNCVDDFLGGMPADLVLDRMEVGYWQDPVTLPPERQVRPPLIHYLLGDRLMKFSAYRRTFGDLLEQPHYRCGFVTIITVVEPFDRYLSRLVEHNKRSVLL